MSAFYLTTPISFLLLKLTFLYKKYRKKTFMLNNPQYIFYSHSYIFYYFYMLHKECRFTQQLAYTLRNTDIICFLDNVSLCNYYIISII